ncbi:hypothetical protein [uncultured Olegusella sp.]|uniref:hypothetical protein n=1 Tax=uncultured Olegusella sp. TaxID=1979846 RepID=UPI0026109E61|nr:hypothetical protein [uncultured Olegusella sp.]
MRKHIRYYETPRYHYKTERDNTVRTALIIVVAILAFELLYDLTAWLYTGIALGFSHAYLPWYASSVMSLVGVL